MPPLIPDSLDTLEINISEKMMMAKTSGGPMSSVSSAMGPIRLMVMMSEIRSPETEETSAISSALRPLPCRVSDGPSNVVAMDAPVPGIPTSIAEMLPPKIPPLVIPMRKGMPTMGSSLNEIGNSTATARVVVSPGMAPTNMPIVRPMVM